MDSGRLSINRFQIENARPEGLTEKSGGGLARAVTVRAVRSPSEVLQTDIAAIWSEAKAVVTSTATLAFSASQTGQGRMVGRLCGVRSRGGSLSAAGISVSTSPAVRVPGRPT